MKRGIAAIAAAVLFAGAFAGAVVLAVQNGHLQAQIAAQAATRNARHDAFCAYLRGETGLTAVPGLARLASLAYQAEGCAPQPLP